MDIYDQYEDVWMSMKNLWESSPQANILLQELVTHDSVEIALVKWLGSDFPYALTVILWGLNAMN